MPFLVAHSSVPPRHGRLESDATDFDGQFRNDGERRFRTHGDRGTSGSGTGMEVETIVGSRHDFRHFAGTAVFVRGFLRLIQFGLVTEHAVEVGIGLADSQFDGTKIAVEELYGSTLQKQVLPEIVEKLDSATLAPVDAADDADGRAGYAGRNRNRFGGRTVFAHMGLGLRDGKFGRGISRFAVSDIRIQKRAKSVANVRKGAFRKIGNVPPSEFRAFLGFLIEGSAGPRIAYEKEIRPVTGFIPMAHYVRRKQPLGDDSGFFEKFPLGSLGKRFARFEPSGRDRPISIGPAGIGSLEHENQAFFLVEQEYVESNDDFRSHGNR